MAKPSPFETNELEQIVGDQLAQARALLAQGEPKEAFSLFIEVCQQTPMTPRLAAWAVRLALKSDSAAAGVTLLNGGVQDNEGEMRGDVRRHLSRLLRKVGELDLARECLVLSLAERPGDARTRRVLNALLEREQRWEELDASLEKEVKEALRRGLLRRAGRGALQRARLWGEHLSNPAHAALRYAQAAEYFEQANDFEAALDLRLLWLNSLQKSRAPASHLEEAVGLCILAGERAGKKERARDLAEQMGFSPALQLLSAAEEAEQQGKQTEAAALLSAAVAEGSHPEAEKRLEAHYVARGAWRQLVDFYRDRGAQTSKREKKVEYLTRMAELLESELKDLAGAARAYGQIVQLSSDRRALEEQVRLLSLRQDNSGIRRALDFAVESASHEMARADLLVARAEEALSKQRFDEALGDFDEALTLSPRHLRACAGKMEALGDPDAAIEAAGELRQLLAGLPVGHPGRLDALIRLAQFADSRLSDDEMAMWAWQEVLVEEPNSARALGRLPVLARRSGNDAQLEHALRALLASKPRGPRARKARIELVQLLERRGRKDEAMEDLRQAVHFEPGHQEAWMLLFQRYLEREQKEEAAWAMEQAATATEDIRERRQIWLRLAHFSRETLADEPRAGLYEARADTLRQMLSGMEESGQVTQLEVDSESGTSPSVPTYADPEEEYEALALAAEENPLSAAAYRALSQHWLMQKDDARGALFAEIARALESEGSPAVLPHRILLTASDRASLRPPALRTPATELLSLLGPLLCRHYLGAQKWNQPLVEFDMGAGRGGRAVADALSCAVRILGIRSPDVYNSKDRGPPLGLVYAERPRLMVGRAALSRQVSAAELRFYAGRALFAQVPDLLALRMLTADELERGVALVRSALFGEGTQSAISGLLAPLTPSTVELLGELYEKGAHQISWRPLITAARHAVNRAGLLVAGGVGPALEALGAKRALEREMVELVRFAASDAYLELRSRKLD